ncbi:MAG: ketol-acid reductoisomerase, partial [Chloroflexi bacterium]|nr:ketol-acid reductoisomerase [Chloroflexota bacterium]
DYVSGKRVISDQTKQEMKRILADIQSGAFAEQWLDENAQGRPNFYKLRQAAQTSRIETVGHDLRAMMQWLNPKEVPSE